MMLKPSLTLPQIHLTHESPEPRLVQHRPPEPQREKVQTEIAKPDSGETAYGGPRGRDHVIYSKQSGAKHGDVLQYKCQAEDSKRMREIGSGHAGHHAASANLAA